MSLSLTDSRSDDAKAPDQYGELSQNYLAIQKLRHCPKSERGLHYPDVFIPVKCITTKNGHFKPRDLDLLTLNGCTDNLIVLIFVIR